MTVLMLVAGAGVIALLGLAVVVGRLEGGAQRRAWGRIAAQRRALAELERTLAEQRAELLDWEEALVDESERRRRRL